MTEQTEDRTARIIDSNIAQLEHEIAKLNRRADKIDCPHISYRITETNMVPDPTILRQVQKENEHSLFPIPKEIIDAIPLVRQHTVEILGDGPKIDGWKFVGTLDHYTIPGKVLVQAVPGETVPERYFDHEATCDHCNYIRRRIETFVLEGTDDNAGEWMLVGRNCLRDFFGHDPMYVVRFLNRIWNFIDSLDDEKWSSGGGRYEHYYDSLEVLSTTNAMIRTFGWLAKSAAGYDRTPTMSHVIRFLNPPAYAKEREAWENWISTIIFDKEEDLAEAEAAIVWLKAKEADKDNNYIHNLKLLEDETHIPSKMIGYWCSLIAAYQREQERLEYAKIEKARRLNEYVGEIGERLEIQVECTGVQSITSDWGVVNIHRMLDESGRTLVWFANAGRKMDKGETYHIRTRVKKQDEYKEWKQTIVSRLNVVEHIPQKEEVDGKAAA